MTAQGPASGLSTSSTSSSSGVSATVGFDNRIKRGFTFGDSIRFYHLILGNIGEVVIIVTLDTNIIYLIYWNKGEFLEILTYVKVFQQQGIRDYL